MSEGATKRGRVVAVCIGEGGIPKHPVDGATCGPLGLEGDGHRFHLHGGERRALCLLAVEELARLEAEGIGGPAGLAPGSFGENLLVEGLDVDALRPGHRLAFEGGGERVVCELFDVRSPCKTLTAVDPRLPDLMLGRSGFVARVLEPGRLAPDMEVRVL